MGYKNNIVINGSYNIEDVSSDNIEVILNDVKQVMSTFAWSSSDSNLTKQSLYELIKNCIEHGEGHTKKPIKLDILVSSRNVDFTITDNKNTKPKYMEKLFNQGKKAKEYNLDQRAQELLRLKKKRVDLGKKKEGGFGLFLTGLYMGYFEVYKNTISTGKYRKV